MAGRYRDRDDAMPRSFRREMCDAFRSAFATALEQLSAHERNLLRHECLEGLTIDETAKRYGVSSSTVARWRARCRVRIFRLTRRAFRDLESRHDFDGTLSIVEGELDVGLSRLLGNEVEPIGRE